MVSVPLSAAALADGAAALADEPPELGAAADVLGLVVAAPGPQALATSASPMTNGANLRVFMVVLSLLLRAGRSSPLTRAAGRPGDVETDRSSAAGSRSVVRGDLHRTRLR